MYVCALVTVVARTSVSCLFLNLLVVLKTDTKILLKRLEKADDHGILVTPVSYTHLDVYKRQLLPNVKKLYPTCIVITLVDIQLNLP